MKPIGNHGDLGSPEQGEHGKDVRAGRRDEFVIVPIDDDFDIDAVFRSEDDTPSAPPAAAAVQVPVEVIAPALVARVDPGPGPDEAASIADLPLVVRAPVVQAVPKARGESDGRLTPEPGPHDRKAAALLIADLIDNHVHLEWHEAVAIAQHLCDVMARDPGANVHRSLVEPWNVEITDAGEVQVLPGGSSSDPLVKQVGRVLRVLLQDSIAPAELRLVASQASFEVPVYSSVDELSAALRHFERPGKEEAIRAAYNRGLEAKMSGLPRERERDRTAPAPVRPKFVEPAAPVKRAAAKPVAQPRPGPVRTRSWIWMYAARVAAATLVAGTAVFMTSRFMGNSLPWRSPAPPPQQAPTVRRRPAAAAPTRRQAAPDLAAPVTVAPQPVPPARGPALAQGRAVLTVPRRPAGVDAAPETGNLPAASAPRSAEPVVRPAAGESVEAAVRRASALLAEGRDGEAAVIFDGIVMRSPLYQLDPVRNTPEALAAFQHSKRLLLPAMARRYYQEARVAYDAGDFSLTLTKGERALALLRDADMDPADADLNGEVSNLMTLASSARTLEESKIYTSADRDVTPPRPVGRQLSTASLSGRAPQTGRLELVVGLSGEVETVKLDTPVNGYHDRMIVSAAKAWHYRPALRKGRPVRYNVVMSITLPDF